MAGITRAKLMEKVTAMVASSGRAYVTSTVDQNEIANHKMVEFAEMTRCLYDDAVPVTLSVGTPIYDLRGVAFTKDFCHIDQIFIEGIALRTYQNKPGLVSLKELQNNEAQYLLTDSGRPRRACLINPNSVRIWPKPDAVYTNCYASGYIVPQAIDTSSGGNNTPIDFNTEDADALAAWIAVGLTVWNATSESDYERMAFFSKPAQDRMKKLMERMEGQIRGPMIRGATNPTRMVAYLG